MCGRYAASRSPEDLIEEFEVVEDHTTDDDTTSAVAPDYNVAPTKTAPVVVERAPRRHDDGASAQGDEATDAAADDAGRPVRQLRQLVWGLVPSWAKDRSVGSRMINARAESLLDKPAFRKAATSRRCLVPADGWYEWQPSPTVTDKKGKPRKQPFFVSDAEGDVLALAGVYEFWRDSSRDPDDPLAWLTTYAIVTTAAAGHLERIHDRMPLALPRDRWDRWLDPSIGDADDIRALIQPVDVSRFQVTAVSTRVNDVRNGGSELLEPISPEELLGAVDPVTGEVLGGSQDAGQGGGQGGAQDSALF